MALLPPQTYPLPTYSDPSSLNTFFDMLSSTDRAQQLDGLVGLRKLLSMEHNPPIQEIIDTGNVPKILEFLNWDDEPKFQFESAWAITNICSGTSQHVAYIVQIGGLEPIGRLLLSNSTDVVDQAVWAIGNIAGDSAYYRDLCLKNGFMDKFVATIAKFSHHKSIIRNAVWGLSNLIRGKPMPPYEQVAIALPVLAQALAAFASDMNIVTDALWGISYLSEMNPQQIIDIGCVPILISYLAHGTASIVTPALRALGNIVTGDDYQTNVVLSSQGFLPLIFGLTSNSKKSIRKEAFWTLSNIAAGNPQQIQTILDVPEYMKTLKDALDSTVEVATEAAWCWTNFLAGASLHQLTLLIKDYDCLKCLNTILSNPKSKVKLQVVDAAQRTLSKLKSTSDFAEYLQMFKDSGLYDNIMQVIPNKGEFLKPLQDFEAYFENSGIEKTNKETDKTVQKTDEEKAEAKAKTKANKHEDDRDDDEEDEDEDEDDEDDDEDEDDEEEEEGDGDEKEEGESDDENNPYNNPARED